MHDGASVLYRYVDHVDIKQLTGMSIEIATMVWKVLRSLPSV